MKARTVARLLDLPNVGPATAKDFQRLGITTPAQLVGKDPFELYDALNQITGVRHDPCTCDVFIAAVRFMEGGPAKPWWAFTAERKRVFGARAT